VVAAQDADFGGVFDFEGQQQAKGLNTLPSAINIVPQEKIGRLGRKAAILEDPKHIIVLAMDVSANFDGSGELDQHGLLHKYFFGCADQSQDLLLLQLDLLTRLGRPHLQQCLYDIVNVQFHLVVHTKQFKYFNHQKYGIWHFGLTTSNTCTLLTRLSLHFTPF